MKDKTREKRGTERVSRITTRPGLDQYKNTKRRACKVRRGHATVWHLGG